MLHRRQMQITIVVTSGCNKSRRRRRVRQSRTAPNTVHYVFMNKAG
jgi:hypothetical protein